MLLERIYKRLLTGIATVQQQHGAFMVLAAQKRMEESVAMSESRI